MSCQTQYAGREVTDRCDECHHVLLAHQFYRPKSPAQSGGMTLVTPLEIRCSVCDAIDDIRAELLREAI